ncbi:MAG: hypothetical protein LBM69_01380 [Lachnospiraceae bacterium]|jgi:hypothetical protein|nr:hypothetical protein [Lachnospiraceae bacterium]
MNRRQSKLAEQKPYIVRQANEFGKLIPTKRDGKRQFRNLVSVAATVDCVEELRLFILYKAHKEGTRSYWETVNTSKEAQRLIQKFTYGKTNVSLAEVLSDKLLHLKSIADRIEQDSQEVYLEVVRLFLGYLYWNVCILTDEQRGNA